MPTITELKEARQNVWEEMQTFMAEAGKRTWGAEDDQKFDRFTKDLDRREAEIGRQETVDKLAAQFGRVDRSALTPGGGGPVETGDAKPDKAEQYRSAFTAYLQRGRGSLTADEVRALDNGAVQATGDIAPEARALGIGTTTAGGYTVPPGYRAELIETMKAYGGMLNEAEVIETATGANLQWPTVDDTNNVGAILAENTQVTQQDVTFGTASIDAYMYTSKMVLISLQLLQDSAFNLETWLRGRLGIRIGRILNTHFTVGTGTSQPDGLVPGTPVGKQGATGQTTTVLYDDLIDLIDSLDPAYQGSAKFMLSQQSRKAIRKLKDTQGHPLWQPSVQAGVPDLLLGYGYSINQDVPTPAASAKSILFGDFKQAYLIRLVTDLAIARLGERYADYAQVGFVGLQRADGTLQNASAVRAYQNSAT